MMILMGHSRHEAMGTGRMSGSAPRVIGIAAALVLVAAACGEGASSGGAPTRQDALDIVLAEVVDVSEHADIEIFATAQPLPVGTTIAVEFDESVEGPAELAILDDSAWVFFADLAPGWKFEHPAQIILVQVDNGSVDVFDVGWWPLIDGQERWRTVASREDSGEKMFSKLTTAPPDPAVSARVFRADFGLAAVPSYCRPEDIQKWALTVTGSDDGAVKPGPTTQLALRLKTYGYQAEVLKPANLLKTVETVRARLRVIRQKMVAAEDGGYCDEFLLVWSGHGSSSGRLLLENDRGQKSWIDGDSLAKEVDRTTEHIEGMQVRVAIDTCYSGIYIERFVPHMPLDPNGGEVRHVHVLTATDASELASGDNAPGTTFTQDLYDCIEELGGVDFDAMLACTRRKAWTQTPQPKSWWNDGD